VEPKSFEEQTSTPSVTSEEPTPSEEQYYKFYITHSLAFEQDFGDTTEAELMADTLFTKSLKTSLVDAVSKGISEFDVFSIGESNILLYKFTLSDPGRRLTAGTSPRLAVKSLTIDYAIEVPAGVTTHPTKLVETLVANTGAFETAMTASYVAAYHANTGQAPVGFSRVRASNTASVTDDPAHMKNSLITSTTTTAAAIEEEQNTISTAAAKEEERNDSTIMVVVIAAIAGLASSLEAAF